MEALKIFLLSPKISLGLTYLLLTILFFSNNACNERKYQQTTSESHTSESNTSESYTDSFYFAQETRTMYKHQLGINDIPCSSQSRSRTATTRGGPWSAWDGNPAFKYSSCTYFIKGSQRYKLSTLGASLDYTGLPIKIELRGKELYTLNKHDGLVYNDLTDPSQSKFIFTQPPASETLDFENLVIQDDSAYLLGVRREAASQRFIASIIQPLDLSIPKQPKVLLEYIFTSQLLGPVHNFADYPWVADKQHYLWAMDDENSYLLNVNPLKAEFNSFKQPDRQYLPEIAIKDQYLYMFKSLPATKDLELEVFDIHNPQSISLATPKAAILKNAHSIQKILIIQDTAYVLTISNLNPSNIAATLYILDIQVPQVPLFVNSYTLPKSQSATLLNISDGYAYIMSSYPDNTSALQIIDVADPQNITLAKQITPQSSTNGKFLVPWQFTLDNLYALEGTTDYNHTSEIKLLIFDF